MTEESQETRDPETIRREIEETREELAETAAALAEKADVKARAHEKVEEVKTDLLEKVTEKVDAAKQTVSGAKETVTEKLPGGGTNGSDPTSGAGVRESAEAALHGAAGTVRQKPVPFGIAAAVIAGFALGWLVARR